MKALSIDLRERIVSAYEQGQGSQAALAQRFNVSLSSVERLMRLKRQTGSVEPKPHQSGHQPIVKEDDFTLIEDLLKAEDDLIQAELAQRFTDQTGRSVSQPTISRVLRRMEITRKKNDKAHASPARRCGARTPGLQRVARYGGSNQHQSGR